MDIRTKTGIIIRRGNEWLVGRIVYSRELRWSRSPWDAWITRHRLDAERVARATGGTMWLFNPVAGQLKILDTGDEKENAGAGC